MNMNGTAAGRDIDQDMDDYKQFPHACGRLQVVYSSKGTRRNGERGPCIEEA